MADIDIYTDGACSGNPGPGGWGALVRANGETCELSGGAANTTNNQMELMAAIKGLEAVDAGSLVTVHSDSQYLVNTMTKGWKRNANHDLWARLDALAASRDIRWEWVRGHNGHPENEAADRLAVAQRDRFGGNGGALGKAPAASAAAASAAQPTEHVVAAEPSGSRGLTHLDAQGQASMVDVSDKPDSDRTAVAFGAITMKPETLAMILQGRVEKGDVFTVARLAGINAAKHTWELIPLAHQIPLGKVSVEFETDPAAGRVAITALARTHAKTGVEMEALTAASVAALTIYDMCKAVDRGMTIGEVHLLEKHGGTHGDYVAGV